MDTAEADPDALLIRDRRRIVWANSAGACLQRVLDSP
jgi:hypothetical protein